MIKVLRKNLILIFILVFSLFLYLYKVGTVPPGLTWDEAAIGYNAYSLLKTGRDEHGQFLPIIFKSFGDYKPGLYIYTTIPAVAIFGLNEASVRLPSALAGVAAIFLIYLISNQLLKNKNTSLFAALIASLMPYHFHYSRGAWETNLSLTLTLLALYLFIRFIKNRFVLYPSLIFFALTLFTYQSAKMITPLVFIATLFILRPSKKTFTRLKTNRKDLLTSLILIVFIACFYFYTFSSSSANRLSRLSIFNSYPQITTQQQQLSFNNSLLAHIFYSPQYQITKAIASRYLYHFSSEVLFYKGAPSLPRESLPVTGLLHLPTALFLLLGFISLARQKNKKVFILLMAWLLIAPLPAAFTLREYSPTRTLLLIAPLSIIAASGMQLVFKKNKLIFTSLLLVYFFYAAFFFQTYFQQGPKYFSKGFNYGYKQAVQQIQKQKASQVLFTDVLGQPYIYYLFYTQYDPAAYQQNNDYTDQGIDVGKVGRVGNVSFQQFAESEIKTRKNTLFIGSVGNISNNYNLTQSHIDFYTSIDDFNNIPIFRIIKTK